MARSKLGPLTDDDFQHDIPNIPDADKAYGPEFHGRMKALNDRIAAARHGASGVYVAQTQKEAEALVEQLSKDGSEFEVVHVEGRK